VRIRTSHVASAHGEDAHGAALSARWGLDVFFPALERLARYCARPAVSLERLSLLPDGRFAYRVKWGRRGGPTHRLMTPLELLARLAALLPPPRHPLVRYHGVFAPNSPWRKSVVPVGKGESCAQDDAAAHPPDTKRAAPTAPTPTTSQRDARAVRTPTPAGSDDATPVRADHGGQVAARLSRIDWATLLRRTYDVDVLACAACGGRLRFVAVVTDASAAREALTAAGLDAAAPPLARARSPDDGDAAARDAHRDPRADDSYADPPAPLD